MIAQYNMPHSNISFCVKSYCPVQQPSKGQGLGSMIVRSIVDLHQGKISKKSDGLGHGCTSTLEIPIIRSPASQKNRDEIPIICTSGSETVWEEREGAKRREELVERLSEEKTENPVAVEKEAEEKKKEEEKKEEKKEENSTSEQQILRSPAYHSPTPSFNPVMATIVEAKEHSVDHQSIEPILPSSHASDDSSCYHLQLTTKVKKQLYLLIVDDSALNRRMIIKLLGDHICDQAVDGVEAVAKYAEKVNLSKSALTVNPSDIAHAEKSSGGISPISSRMYDAILMDFMMPNMDGPTATEIIKGMGYTGPVLGITGKYYSYDLQIYKSLSFCRDLFHRMFFYCASRPQICPRSLLYL